MPGRPLEGCLLLAFNFFFRNQKVVLVSGMPVVRLCGWSVGWVVRFLVVVWVWFLGYLDDGDVEERAAEADGEGGGGHDGRAGQEPHGHGERRHLVPARDDPRLQRHEQTCTVVSVSDSSGARIRFIYCSIGGLAELRESTDRG